MCICAPLLPPSYMLLCLVLMDAEDSVHSCVREVVSLWFCFTTWRLEELNKLHSRKIVIAVLLIGLQITFPTPKDWFHGWRHIDFRCVGGSSVGQECIQAAEFDQVRRF